MLRIVTLVLVASPAIVFLAGDPDQPWLAWIVDKVKAENREAEPESPWAARATDEPSEPRTYRELLAAAYSTCNSLQARPHVLKLRQYSRCGTGIYVVSGSIRYVGPDRFAGDLVLRDRNGRTRVRVASDGKTCWRERHGLGGNLQRTIVSRTELPGGPGPLVAEALERLRNATAQRVTVKDRSYLLVTGTWKAETAGDAAKSETLFRAYLEEKSLWPRRMEWLEAEVGGRMRLAFDFYYSTEPATAPSSESPQSPGM